MLSNFRICFLSNWIEEKGADCSGCVGTGEVDLGGDTDDLSKICLLGSSSSVTFLLLSTFFTHHSSFGSPFYVNSKYSMCQCGVRASWALSQE